MFKWNVAPTLSLHAVFCVQRRCVQDVLPTARKSASRIFISVVLMLATRTTAVPSTFEYEMVEVSDVANAADSTGYGRVTYAYRIGKYEVTLGQYSSFLRSITRNRPRDPKLCHDSLFSTGGYSGGLDQQTFLPQFRSSDGRIYYGTANKPVTYIDYRDQLRFANWMSNGQPVGLMDATTTEDGAYDLSVSEIVPRNAINPNTGEAPLFVLPSEDEWYKAAYYNPETVSYSEFATGYSGLSASDANWAPGGNYAEGSLVWGANMLSNVGSYKRSSFYGTFDQTGNVWEMVYRADGTLGMRGGMWKMTSAIQLSKNYREIGLGDNDYSGIRLASSAVVVVPEPACLLLVGSIGVGMFFFNVLDSYFRRKSRLFG